MKHTQIIHKFRFNFWGKDSMYETYYLRIWELHGFSKLACSCMINAIFLYLHRSYVVLSFYALLCIFYPCIIFQHSCICILSFIVHFFVLCDQRWFFCSYESWSLYNVYVKFMLHGFWGVTCFYSAWFGPMTFFTVHRLHLWYSLHFMACTASRAYYLCLKDWWLSISSTCLLVWTVFQILTMRFCMNSNPIRTKCLCNLRASCLTCMLCYVISNICLCIWLYGMFSSP